MHIDSTFSLVLCSYSRQVIEAIVDSFSSVNPGIVVMEFLHDRNPQLQKTRSSTETVLLSLLNCCQPHPYLRENCWLRLKQFQKKGITNFSRLSYTARTLHSYINVLTPKALLHSYNRSDQLPLLFTTSIPQEGCCPLLLCY